MGLTPTCVAAVCPQISFVGASVHISVFISFCSPCSPVLAVRRLLATATAAAAANRRPAVGRDAAKYVCCCCH